MRAIKTILEGLQLRKETSEAQDNYVRELVPKDTRAKLPRSKKQFEYQPLETPDTIRVIHIRLGNDVGVKESIKCDIEHIQIDEASYDALSYEWGLPADDDPVIFLNGDFYTGDPFTVRRNLFDALHALRSRREHDWAFPIWIDALSINQSDTRERNRQVEHMGRIYREARLVRIWPGLTDHRNYPAMGAINSPSFDRHTETDDIWEDTIHPAVLELCQKPYWNRVWVQQEVFLGGRIFIESDSGSLGGFGYSVDYQRFDHILGRMTRNDRPCSKEISLAIQQSAANALATRKRLPLDSSRLASWLRLACRRGLETSEPRDLIYAMLGISSDCQAGGIEPDYDKPLIDVYLETIHFCGLHKPGHENKQFRKTLAQKLGLLWDSEMETRIQEYCEQKATVRRED